MCWIQLFVYIDKFEKLIKYIIFTLQRCNVRKKQNNSYLECMHHLENSKQRKGPICGKEKEVSLFLNLRPLCVTRSPYFPIFWLTFCSNKSIQTCMTIHISIFFSWNEVVAAISDTTLRLIIVSAPHFNAMVWSILKIQCITSCIH